jgi:hypothetical protein
LSQGGWGSIEYGGNSPGQVPGGRWKPFQYLLKASAYADQLGHCAQDGLCFLKHDGIRAFEGGQLVVRVWSLITGQQTVLSRRNVSLPPGPAVTQWLCASAHNDHGETTAADTSGYQRFYQLIPSDRSNFTGFSGTLLACEAACTKEAACTGFTRGNTAPDGSTATCYLYAVVPSLNGAAPSASFYLKPGKPVPPHTPAPPGPPPPPPLPPAPPAVALPSCSPFSALLPAAGCAANGTDCVLSVQVLNATGDVVSSNTNLFVAPKSLEQLPNATISVTVGQPQGERVPITLRPTHLALYVVLTTLARGRFSDNVLLLPPGQDTRIEFIVWGGGAGAVDVLRKSLRVESLGSYL